MRLDLLKRRAALRDLPDDVVIALDELARGSGQGEIAKVLDISTTTVDRRLRTACEALGAEDRSHLRVMVRELGLGRD